MTTIEGHIIHTSFSISNTYATNEKLFWVNQSLVQLTSLCFLGFLEALFL